MRWMFFCLTALLHGSFIVNAAKILVYCPSISKSHVLLCSKYADLLHNAGHDTVWIHVFFFFTLFLVPQFSFHPQLYILRNPIRQMAWKATPIIMRRGRSQLVPCRRTPNSAQSCSTYTPLVGCPLLLLLSLHCRLSTSHLAIVGAFHSFLFETTGQLWRCETRQSVETSQRHRGVWYKIGYFGQRDGELSHRIHRPPDIWCRFLDRYVCRYVTRNETLLYAFRVIYQ